MSEQVLSLEFVTRTGTQARQATVRQLVVAGWTGRDRAAMEKHIVELEALGVRRPASTPVYYRVATSRLTLAPSIQVSGGESSGEVEFVLAQFDGRLWVGLGSDHTDRKVETIGVTISKQLCEKPIGARFWAFDEVAAHWDQLVLRAFIVEGGKRTLYQEGPVTTMQDPRDLLAAWTGGEPVLAEGTLMFCGTLAAKGGIRPAWRFEMELHDPVLQRTLAHAYDIETLPIAG
ncbi:MAG TPA: DUF2848 domain-containing protein [Ramlibacter sp.]|uniref:DUF2848 domain-containing protein n=1 Tax=Ramlibacter sp. TaxID=1917967 RepID=UPI002D80DA2F|nr:DUF2848 domain-containing protein [Ramlibacter sp.]HET8744680.1 DUF2848 domain-containing protein [Ramlibacter sp.]